MIYVVLAWLLLGVGGYFLMRQGSLLGKNRAWGKAEVFAGIVGAIVLGPIFILIALKIEGKNCIKRRKA